MSARSVKSVLWHLLALPLMFFMYWIVISAGMRAMTPIFRVRLSRAPLLSFFADYESLYRIDIAHLASLLMMCTMYFVVWRNLRLILAPTAPVDAEHWNQRAELKVVRIFGGLLLVCELFLFYLGLSETGGSLWGSGSGVLFRLVATLYYLTQLCTTAYVSVFHSMR